MKGLVSHTIGAPGKQLPGAATAGLSLSARHRGAGQEFGSTIRYGARWVLAKHPNDSPYALLILTLAWPQQLGDELGSTCTHAAMQPAFGGGASLAPVISPGVHTGGWLGRAILRRTPHIPATAARSQWRTRSGCAAEPDCAVTLRIRCMRPFRGPVWPGALLDRADQIGELETETVTEVELSSLFGLGIRAAC